MRKIPVLIISMVVLLVLVITLCTFTRKPYEKVILDRFGDVIDNPTNIAYNWYWCLPTDRVVRFDTRLHLYQSKNIETNTKSSEPVTIRSFAAWRVVDPGKFYRTLGGSDENARGFLDKKIPGRVSEVLGRHDLSELFNQTTADATTEQMEEDVTAAANKDLSAQGLEIEQVGFSRMGFPPPVASQVYARMAAERNKLAQQFRSEGQTKAATIRAEGMQYATVTVAEAQSKAEQIRGQGDAQAIQILSDVQNTKEAEDFYNFWKTMEIFKNSLTKRTVLVLTPDDPLWKKVYGEPKFPPPATQPTAANDGFH